MNDTTTAGSEPSAERRFHGHVVRGPASALRSFGQLDSSTQGQYIREAQHYGVTRLILNDVPWELARSSHAFSLREMSNHAFL